MAVEDQVVAAALAGQPSSHVEPLGGQGVLPRLEAILAQPVVHVLARQTLAARRTVDVAECEREIDYLLAVDQLDHIIWGHVPVPSSGVATIPGSIPRRPCYISTALPWRGNGPPSRAAADCAKGVSEMGAA